MARMCVMLVACLVFLVAGIFPDTAGASVEFEKLHASLMQTSQAYREADRDLNATWNRLRKTVSREEFTQLLQNQRAWLKERGSMLEFERDKEKAMVKCLRDRIAFLNLKIAQADHTYISFATDIVRDDDTVCVVIKPSRPLVMNNHRSCVAGGEKDKAVEGILLEKKRKSMEQDLQNVYGQDGLLSPDVTEYFEYNRFHMDPSFYGHFERSTIEMANNNLVCISEAFSFSIGMARPFSGITETQFIDRSTGNQITFDDLFMYPDVARETARGIASIKVAGAAAAMNRDLSRVLDALGKYDFTLAFIRDNCVYLQLDKPDVAPINDSETLNYLDVPLKVHLDDLKAAGPKSRYFR